MRIIELQSVRSRWDDERRVEVRFASPLFVNANQILYFVPIDPAYGTAYETVHTSEGPAACSEVGVGNSEISFQVLESVSEIKKLLTQSAFDAWTGDPSK